MQTCGASARPRVTNIGFADSCGDDEQCGGAAPIAVATVRDGPTKRSSLDRLNGGHTLATKRSSLDRLNGGHTLVAKRDSLDRLSGDFIGYVAADECDDVDGCGRRSNAAPVKRSLDRLNGGHTMVAKRGSLDRLNGDFISFADECDGCDPSSLNLAAAAKRMSLDRLNGGHTMVAKRSSLDRLNGGHTMMMAAGRSTEGGYSDRWWSDDMRDTIDRLSAGGPLSVHRRDVQPRQRTWSNDAVQQFVDRGYYADTSRGCVGCAPIIKSSSY